MKKRRILSLVLVVILCFSIIPINAAATEIMEPNSNDIQPCWANISDLTCILTITGTNADCFAEVVCYSGTSEIKTKLTLYKETSSGWQYVSSWTSHVYDDYVTMAKDYTVLKGYNYKLVFYVDAYRNGVWESVNKTSAIRYCG